MHYLNSIKNVVDGTKTLKDINGLIIPKLEELRKDLLVKIKEIKIYKMILKTIYPKN